MLKRLVVKNFESHENTELDLDVGLTEICGQSDCGKSSLVRALRLVMFNEWNPESLRVGAGNAEVEAYSEKGYVKVRRGKVNEWEVCVNGKVTSYEKIGSSILPEIYEVFGVRYLTIGEKKINVCLMNQMEGHFFISEIDGENASGSFRAQVLDELCGMGNIEGLIKAVSLDLNRVVRERNEKDLQYQELKSKISMLEDLDKEEIALKDARILFDELLVFQSVIERFDAFIFEANDWKRQEREKEALLSEIRVDASLLEDVFDAENSARACFEAIDFQERLKEQVAILKGKEEDWSKVCGAEVFLKELETVEQIGGVVVGQWSFFEKASYEVEKSKEMEKELLFLKKDAEVLGEVVKEKEELEALREKTLSEIAFLENLSGEKSVLGSLGLAVGEQNKKLEELEKQISDLERSFSFCPLTLKPIKESCWT